MSWQAYKLVYQAMGPIHIGWHTLGYIKLTRHFIPGKNIWGALTANLTRTYGSGTQDYEYFGNKLKGESPELLPGYFYPSYDRVNPLLPRFTKKGLQYGKDLYKSKFEKTFIGSTGQTAILPASNAAEDETLHESEYIGSQVEIKGQHKPVFFIGHLFLREDSKDFGWSDYRFNLHPVIKEIFVGGDKKYGWGRLQLVNDPETDGPQRDIFGHKLVKDPLSLRINKEEPLPAHIKISNAIKIKGDIEPLVGREWSTGSEVGTKNGAGQMISKVELCWIPGSMIDGNEETIPVQSATHPEQQNHKNIHWMIEDHGVLHIVHAS